MPTINNFNGIVYLSSSEYVTLKALILQKIVIPIKPDWYSDILNLQKVLLTMFPPVLLTTYKGDSM